MARHNRGTSRRRARINTRKKELYVYSLFWGILTFGTGVLTTLLTLPENLSFESIPDWKVASWVWLNAHGIPIAEQSVTGSAFDTGNLDFIQPTPELHMLRVLPLFLAAIAAILLVNSMNGSSSDSELFEFSVMAGGGYIIAGLATIVISEARPGIVMIIILIGLLGAAAYIGSSIANSLRLPVFAVTSISGIVGIGLVGLLGAGAILTVAIPLGKLALSGSLAAVAAVWVGNNLDI